jgi:carbon-monoxide dehydrogenase medium subunit
VIPADFEYVAPTTLAEAVAALGEAGEDAKILAGGQSLIPVLRLRLAFPTTLVDLSRVAELRGVTDDGGALVIGAMTKHSDVIEDPLVQQHAPLLAVATSTVADPAVRHRGTFGGALAHADPAGDLAAVALALDAELVAEGPGGRRTIAAQDFFVDYLETSLSPDEILAAVRIPKLPPGTWGVRYEKFNRVAQAWAIVGVAAAVRMEGGAVAEARIGLTNMGSTPVRPSGVEAALVGATDKASVTAACASVADGLNPPSDLGGQADYRAHLARVLTARAVARAAGMTR